METNTDIPEDRWENRRPGERLFTFGLDYPDMGLEEIDLYAPNAMEACRRVGLVAEQDYEPGFTRIVPMDPGGSGGLVTTWRI